MTPQTERQKNWLEPFFEVFKYKPGWEFSLDDDGVQVWVKIIINTEDSRSHHRSGELIPVTANYPVPPEYTADSNYLAFSDWLRWTIHGRAEKHEMDEWFTVGDYRPYDQHSREAVTLERINQEVWREK